MLKIIVGLGNPGRTYENTRHNVGFWFLNALALRYSVSFIHDRQLHGFVARLPMHGETIHLLKPMTYMNNSGTAVGATARYFKVAPRNLLVAHDELDFAAGVIRFKKDGGHGGHNGLRDIMANLNCSNFCRLRIGIGRPDEINSVTRYVLSQPSYADAIKITERMDKAIGWVPDLIKRDYQGFMNSFHRD